MGFAGQVFAARIAVGLAVPSAGALNRTGGVLAKAAGGIYSALAGKRKAAAAERLKGAQQEVERLSATAEENSKKTTDRIAKSAQEGVVRLEQIGKRGAATMRAGGKESMSMIKAGMGKEGDALFKGVQKSMTPLAKLKKMTANFATMTKTQQAAALKQTREIVKAKEEQLKTTRLETKTLQEQKTKMIESGEATDTWLKKQDKKIKASEQNTKAVKEELATVTEEAEVIRGISVQAQVAIGEIKEENTKTTEELTEATKELEEAQEELDEATKELTQDSAQFGTVVTDTVNQAVGNFKEILVESIATLSAFYYKINQNTEALMEFERELLNANSVWNETNEVMFAAGEQVTQFGQRYGMSMQNGATGLYQLASAGLTAAESTEVLNNTLKLSMAVQGDHNTIAKLTTQTLKGFDMEMSESAVVTDKFAHAIQKSLIEYEDLSSAVKFALPFFTSTGQSIDQLLGSLQVLTNRALEAGIAGRGLRQALAEFAEGAEDNDRAFRKMGINILDSEGNMKQLTDIAKEFAAVVGEDTVSNTELLTTLIQDLNVRGATAFVHLVQASDEFSAAVEGSRTASGELDTMVKIQNESLTAQLQILKNNVQGIFQFRDETYVAQGYLNQFHMTVSQMIESLQGLIVVEENGTMVLTDFGLALQDIAVSGMIALQEVLQDIVPVIKEFSKQGFINVDMIRLYTLPLRLVVDLLEIMGPAFTKMLMTFYIMNKILPIITTLQLALSFATLQVAVAKAEDTGATLALTTSQTALLGVQGALSTLIWTTIPAWYTDTIAKIKNFSVTGMLSGMMMSLATSYVMASISLSMMTTAQIAYNIAFYAGIGLLILGVIAFAAYLKKVGYFSDIMTRLTEPGGTLYWWGEQMKYIGAAAIEVGEAIWSVAEAMGTLIRMVVGAPKFIWRLMFGDAEIGGFGAFPGIAGPEAGMATGGYMKPMATGGYLVGERGPELFQPNGGGQLLNNSATNHILEQSADAGFSPAARANMIVTSLTVAEAEMNGSNLNIDSFAGNPAMRRKA